MRYKLWLYKSEGLNTLVAEDTSLHPTSKGSYMLRDQSIYAEDNGKLVWKDAANPVAVGAVCRSNRAICIAEAMHISTLDANMNWRVLDYLWKNCNGQ
ncbi:hypothetical protein HWD31_gp07 [Pantoea phage vB_PagM_SSEM1]|uniref:Uncharacterized protein n=1 Tax=Pantoea phage vB_PagM_SSEM1 TaxID=2721760 RepID=A0A6H0D8F3_9CAUD|nr:hypothetical protein HWD31_gp07 [Pantoea phage vB_PagM_SSEM1]QIS79344.1 hypothetical protein SSEM1_gp07 [Pantoea phage vB_PagM_SSEM1]